LLCEGRPVELPIRRRAFAEWVCVWFVVKDVPAADINPLWGTPVPSIGNVDWMRSPGGFEQKLLLPLPRMAPLEEPDPDQALDKSVLLRVRPRRAGGAVVAGGSTSCLDSRCRRTLDGTESFSVQRLPGVMVSFCPNLLQGLWVRVGTLVHRH
jgi:hypothetical protein